MLHANGGLSVILRFGHCLNHKKTWKYVKKDVSERCKSK